MPEQLKPCPACGSRDCESVVCTISADAYQAIHYKVECGSCYASGPVLDLEVGVIDAWNKLPRRPDYNDVDCAGCPERRRSLLTWTTEQPKVPGKGSADEGPPKKQVTENLLRGELLRRALPYLEASLLGRLYSEMQGALNNKTLHKALEQECSDLETLIEEIRETI